MSVETASTTGFVPAEHVASEAARPEDGVTPRAPPAGPLRPRIPVVDGVRALAMTMVFLCHVGLFSGWPQLVSGPDVLRVAVGRLLWSGASGVDLFMVLSGFCLFLPLCRQNGTLAPSWNARTFYHRRAVRILPAYYGAIAFAALLPFALVVAFRAARLPANWPLLEPPAVYLHHILLLQTFFPGSFGHINAAFWSMGLEVQFYLVFPFIVFCCRRSVMATLATMTTVSIGYLFLIDTVQDRLPEAGRQLYPIFFLGRWTQFAVGMGVAYVVARRVASDRIRPDVIGTGIVAVCSIAYGALQFIPPSRLTSLILPLLYAVTFGSLLFALCSTETSLRRVLEFRPIVGLGYMSYSIFLLHWPIIYYLSQFAQRAFRLSGWSMAAFLICVGFPCVVCVARLSFRYLEEPFLGHRERDGQSSKPMPSQVIEAAVAFPSEGRLEARLESKSNDDRFERPTVSDRPSNSR